MCGGMGKTLPFGIATQYDQVEQNQDPIRCPFHPIIAAPIRLIHQSTLVFYHISLSLYVAGSCLMAPSAALQGRGQCLCADLFTTALK